MPDTPKAEKHAHEKHAHLSPILTISILTLLLLILTVGIIESPDNSEKLIGLFSTPIGVLVLMLRQDYLAYKLEKMTEAKAAEAKDAAVAEAQKTRQTLAATNAIRDNKIDVLTEKVETVVHQTNGGLAEKMTAMKQEIVQAVKENRSTP